MHKWHLACFKQQDLLLLLLLLLLGDEQHAFKWRSQSGRQLAKVHLNASFL